MRLEGRFFEKTNPSTEGTHYGKTILQRIRDELRGMKAYLLRQMMRADVDGCDVFDSFARVVEVEDAEGLGGIAFSEGSAAFWLLFFFFAIAEDPL